MLFILFNMKFEIIKAIIIIISGTREGLIRGNSIRRNFSHRNAHLCDEYTKRIYDPAIGQNKMSLNLMACIKLSIVFLQSILLLMKGMDNPISSYV